MNLIIVESPTKAKTLSRFLDKSFEIEATKGHIKDLPKTKLGIDKEKDFKPDYQIIEKQTENIKLLQKKLARATKIFLATDPDREGEAISAHVNEIVNAKKKVSRIVFHEITKEAVLEAIAHPRQIDRNLVDAQIARRVLDRLVGYELSPLLWKKVRRGLSAGRVQSVAVRLIVEKEREIEAFKSVEYWEFIADLERKSKKESLLATLLKVQGKKAEIHDKKQADKVLSDLKASSYKVFQITKKQVQKNPYAPFTTSTMTQSAARLFGWSAKKTMLEAQRLYERGLITYHRTDSTNISLTAITKVREKIKKEFGDKYLPEKPRFYKVKSKVAQEAHEAIRPTNIEKQIVDEKTSPSGKKLYELIWKRFVACQMTSAVYDAQTVDIKATPKANKTDYILRANGLVTKFDGWKKLFNGKKDSEETILPKLNEDEDLNLKDVKAEQKFTQPPARFNEASLIKTLEKLGIGRPSTYAPIISTIIFRNYVEKEEGKFIPTPIGNAVNDFLIKNFPDVFDYQFTASMEDSLDEVANGREKWNKVIKGFYKPFDKKLGSVEEKSKRVKIEAEKLNKKCPKCKKGELLVRIGRFGKFISCSRFPECDYKDKYVEKIDMKCPGCKKGEVIIKKTGKGRAFFGCSRYPECSWASWQNPKQDPKQKEKGKLT